MSGQVVLYFEDQADALRFALAAGSVMAGDGAKFTNDLVQETARVTRIRLDAVNAGNLKKGNPVRVALSSRGSLGPALPARLPAYAHRTAEGGCRHTSYAVPAFVNASRASESVGNIRTICSTRGISKTFSTRLFTPVSAIRRPAFAHEVHALTRDPSPDESR